MALQLHPTSTFLSSSFTSQLPSLFSIQKKSPSLKLPNTFSCSNSYLPSNKFKRAYTSVMIVPTGIGAAIGGYAGDALPVARARASVVDCLISHPNVGLVLDAGIEMELRMHHLQVADAARASLGLPILEYAVTDKPLEVEKWIDPKTGQSTGRIKHPDSLLRAVQSLMDRSQVNAVAVVGRFPDDDENSMYDYRRGIGVDTLAGIEAIISHLVVKEFQIPCAHAPALLPVASNQSISPKSAAEEIGYKFLPCVMAGLSNAPQDVGTDSDTMEKGCIFANDVDSVILPIDACAGNGVLSFARKSGNKPLIIAVEENTTVLSDTPDKLHIDTVNVSNYWEAIGVIAAHKAGIDPNSLRKNRINNIPFRSNHPCHFNGSALHVN